MNILNIIGLWLSLNSVGRCWYFYLSRQLTFLFCLYVSTSLGLWFQCPIFKACSYLLKSITYMLLSGQPKTWGLVCLLVHSVCLCLVCLLEPHMHFSEIILGIHKHIYLVMPFPLLSNPLTLSFELPTVMLRFYLTQCTKKLPMLHLHPGLSKGRLVRVQTSVVFTIPSGDYGLFLTGKISPFPQRFWFL